MVHIEDNLSRDQDPTLEILAIIASGSSLDMTDQGKMTEVVVDHNHKITEKELHKVSQDVSDVVVAPAIKSRRIVEISRDYWRN